MKVHVHLDPAVLEQELLSRVSGIHCSTDAARTLIVVPTARLAGHVERRLAEGRDCWLGLDVVDLRRLPELILEPVCEPTRSRCAPRVLQALLERQLRRDPDNLWYRYVQRRPGALAAVMRAVTDLREAGVVPEQLEACRLADEGRALAEIYRLYVVALGKVGGRGWTDDAGLVAAALPHAERFAQRYRAIFLHGTYELIGIQLALIRAVDAAVEVQVLLPASDPDSEASNGYSLDYATEFLTVDSAPAVLARQAGLENRPPLDVLYDEERQVASCEGVDFEFRHCQGAASEVSVAVRSALRAIRDGCAPRDIAIVAGALSPYAAALEEALDDAGLPWTSSLASPLCRQPVARDFLLMLELLAEDFPRRPTVELLASPRVRWSRLDGCSAVRGGDRADVWSRKARLLGGLQQWTEALPRWVESSRRRPSDGDEPDDERERRERERREDAERMVAALAALHSAVDPARPRSWSAHARTLDRLLDLLGTESEDSASGQAVDLLGDLLLEMSRLETVVGDRRRVGFAEVRSWLVDAARASELTLRRADDGGIRVLDAMQARGTTFREVHLLGMNSGLFPRTPREDPVLPDPLRRQLRERYGVPLALAGRGHLEQRLLLTMTLGAALQSLTVSWQRADEAGRASNPSLALREVARLAHGKPDLDHLIEAAHHIPSHPIQSLQDLLEKPGLISAEEARLLAALIGSGPESAAPLAERYPELSSGLRMIRATESFALVDATYDARVGPCESEDGLSVSSLETLGRCALQHFFRHVLHVSEMELEVDPLEIEAREWGLVVHDLLEKIYRQLIEEDRFDGAGDDLEREALRLLERELPRAIDSVGSELSRRLPVLWNGVSRSWAVSLESFLRRDLSRIVDGGWKPVALEEVRTEDVDLDGGVAVAMRGRFDRRLVRENGTPDELIGDYKTGKIGKKCDPNNMLKGQTLQVPLYRMMSGDRAAVELLGVGPSRAEGDETLARFSGFESQELARGFRETVRVLVELRNRGTFPFNKGHHCNFCAYTQACRRNHPPSVERELAAADGVAYRLLRNKNRSRPTLARAGETRR